MTCIAGEHDLRLVALAAGVCLLASVVGINLFGRAGSTDGRTRALWLALAGAAAGCGIWATHFIAMLAYEPGVAVAYNVTLTVLSLVIAAVVTGTGFAVALACRRSHGGIVGGILVGAGIAGMHYTGMAALELPGRIVWAPDLVVYSVLFGVLAAAASLTVALRGDSAKSQLAAAGLLALAIVSHHFTAMGAAGILPDPTREIYPFSLAPSSLALAVAGGAILILGLSLAGALADRRVRERDRQLATAVNNMSHGVTMFDAAERLQVFNDRYIEMYRLSRDVVKVGATLEEIIRHRKEVGSLPLDPQEYCDDLRRKLAAGGTVSFVIETPQGKVVAVTCRTMEGGAWVAIHEDVTERRRAEQRAEYLAHHDPLTGLANREAFNAALAEAIMRTTAAGGSFALLCIDLDRFKEINDVFGHQAGDTALREIARRIALAAGDAHVARLGGDEFAVIAEDARPADAAILAERMLTETAAELKIVGEPLRGGISIGVAMFPNDGGEADQLIGNANAALHRAKTEGRATVRFFEAGMDRRLRERRTLQRDLKDALARGEFVLHYQPQARVKGAIIGFEALLRWNHPTRGTIPPGDFIPLAEESGIIVALGEWVLRNACREAASWRNPLRIGVNLSPVQFRHGDLPALVHQVLIETGLSPSRLELEITESVLIDDLTHTVTILRRLKALGVRIAMDDFGTGYSSLSYLQAFPFDTIKIERRFILDLQQKPQSATIVRAVIGLARGLDLPVVAEGVETQEQLDFLEAAHCDTVQGYLIGRPHPIGHYADLVGRERPAPSRVVPLHRQNVA
jgi:diguanylate cyclase (GGDEF)-like protein